MNRRCRKLFHFLDRRVGLAVFPLAKVIREVRPCVHAVLVDLNRAIDGFALCFAIFFLREKFRKVKRRIGIRLHEVLRATKGAVRFVELLLRELRDAKAEPVFAAAARRNNLRKHAFCAFEKFKLHQFLRKHATAVEIFAVLRPMFLETCEEVIAANRNRASLIVLHLNRWAVETEKLPYFFHLKCHRAFHDLLLNGGARRRKGNQHKRIARHPIGERLDRSKNGRATFERDVRSVVGLVRVGWLGGCVCHVRSGSKGV